jgi:threonine dehydrogenase-like Zn-dependent dehydrogenase
MTLGFRVLPSPARAPKETIDALVRAKEFGADELINPLKTENVVQAIRDLTHGRGADASLDASSSPQARAQAVRCVRSWGKACFVVQTLAS